MGILTLNFLNIALSTFGPLSTMVHSNCCEEDTKHCHVEEKCGVKKENETGCSTSEREECDDLEKCGANECFETGESCHQENDKSKISKNKHEKCCLGEKEFSGEDTKEEDVKNVCGDVKVDCKKQNNCNEEKCETHEIEKGVAAL